MAYTAIDGVIGYDNMLVTITDGGSTWNADFTFDFLLSPDSYIEYIGLYLEIVGTGDFGFNTKQPWLDDGYAHPSLAPKVGLYQYTASISIPKGDTVKWKIRYAYHSPNYDAIRVAGETDLFVLVTPTEEGIIDLTPDLGVKTTVKIKKADSLHKRRRSSLVPNRVDLNGWFDSKHAEVDSPDYKGATVSATSTLLGFEDGELAAPITLYGTTLSYTVNVEENRINFTGSGVLVGILIGGVRFSLANGICALGDNDRELELENVTWDGYAVTTFSMVEDLGVVKVGLVYVVNNALGEAQVEV